MTRELFDHLSCLFSCWISSPVHPGNIWVFVAPVTLFILANGFMLIVIINKLMGKNEGESRSTQMGNRIQTTSLIILFFNFGITWILYIFYINQFLKPIFTYVFIVVNGSQGFPFFLDQWLHYRCLGGRKKKRNSRTTNSRSISNSKNNNNNHSISNGRFKFKTSSKQNGSSKTSITTNSSKVL